VLWRAPLGLPRERMPAVRAVGLNPAAGVIAHRADCEPIPRSGKAESGEHNRSPYCTINILTLVVVAPPGMPAWMNAL
jgi:hypothetical protein